MTQIDIIGYCHEYKNQYPRIAEQELEIKKYCANHKLSGLVMYSEDDSAEAMRFPVLDKIFEKANHVSGTIRRGGAIHMVLSGLDRLSKDMVIMEKLISKAQGIGIVLHSCVPFEEPFVDIKICNNPNMKFARRAVFAALQLCDSMKSARYFDPVVLPSLDGLVK
jgi:hypothetical protein